MTEPLNISTLAGTIHAAKVVAVRYRELTGKPLGITGELGEAQAAQLLGLTLADARQAGYDAVDPDGRRLQIKTRCILQGAKTSQRVGRIRLDHDWDAVVLLLIDHNFDPLAAFELPRETIETELKRPGSRSRNERGALAVAWFKSIGKPVWSRNT